MNKSGAERDETIRRLVTINTNVRNGAPSYLTPTPNPCSEIPLGSRLHGRSLEMVIVDELLQSQSRSAWKTVPAKDDAEARAIKRAAKRAAEQEAAALQALPGFGMF